MKGTVLDTVLLPILIFGMFVGVVFGLTIMNGINETGMLSISIPNFSTIMDYGIVFIFFGSLIAAIISAFMIRTHPIFFVISVIMLIIISVTFPVLSNVFMGFATNSQITTYSNQLPLTLNVFANLPIFLVITGILIIIALYSKPGGGEV